MSCLSSFLQRFRKNENRQRTLQDIHQRELKLKDDIEKFLKYKEEQLKKIKKEKNKNRANRMSQMLMKKEEHHDNYVNAEKDWIQEKIADWKRKTVIRASLISDL